MEGILSKLKFSFITVFFIFFSNLFGIEVIVSKVDMTFRTELTPENLEIKDVKVVPNNCKPLKLEELKNDKYLSSKFIKKNQIICDDDVKKVVKKSVIFNFGSIEIETDGKIIYENDEYIRIKKDNGKIEKIYKDGKVR